MPSLAHPQPTPRTDARLPTPAALPVLDAHSAPAWVDGSLARYQELARAYVLELDALGANAKRQLQQADLIEALRMLHSVRDRSLALGAQALAEVCRQCALQTQAAAHAGQALGDAERLRMVEVLQSAAHATRQALEGVLQTAAPFGHPAASTATLGDAVADLQALKVLLRQSDLQALDRYQALQLRHSALRGRVEALGQALHAFDFAQAVVQCDDLICSLGSPA